ncbi:MAG: hypothetical protein AB7V46_17945 [Thermomicrobiales bacterium]
MRVEDLFTDDSIRAFQQRTADAVVPGRMTFEEYVRDREAQLQGSPELVQWVMSLEEGDVASAAAPELWSALVDQGFVTCPEVRAVRGHEVVFPFEVISPKVLDAFRENDEARAGYAFTKVQVCLRKENAVPRGVVVPEGWRDTALVNTELFELPPGVTPDNMDDREKIHVIYLAGLLEGRFVCKPVYIGVGTGEAYGVGPRSRQTHGRFRFYRYDVKDNFALEYVSRRDRAPRPVQSVRELPEVTSITADRATLLLGRGESDGGFMCLSDPKVAEGYMIWLSRNPMNRLVFQEVILEKVCDDLQTGRPTTPFTADDVAAVLNHAWNVHRFYFVAWQHPRRLSDQEGLDLYYRELPAFRREEYEIYRFSPELFGVAPGPVAEELTIPNVLWTENLRERLEAALPGAAARVEQWLKREVVEDLYSYGNHPKLRLCTAIALWQRLWDSGLWSQAVEATYRARLFEISCSSERLCS